MSEYSRNEFLKYNPNIKVIHHGLDDKYHNIPMHKNKIIFSVIGTIEARKGQDILIEAVNLLNKSYIKRCEFHILGKVGDVKF